MSRFKKFVLVLLFPTLLIVISTAVLLADPGDEPFTPRKPITDDAATQSAKTPVAPAVVNGSYFVQEGGFESPPHTAWEQSSTNFGDVVICDKSCSENDLKQSHSGEYWAWFGGTFEEHGILTQTVTIANGTIADLKFFLRYANRGAGALGNDYFRVFLDGNQLFEVTDSQADFDTYGGSEYTEVTLNINSYADGQPHTLVFDANIGLGQGIDDFFVDDVSISVDGLTYNETFVYLPVIFNNYCIHPSYSEFVRYDMNIIDAPEMWGTIKGFCMPGDGIIVAVIDTGVDLDHPDLLVNLVPGATFISGTSTPDDDQGHGTHVAGSAAAAMNDIGIIGVAPFANIMPVKVLAADGRGTSSGVAAGIRWAADHGAKVINLSLSGSSPTSVGEDAVDYATARGALVIAAAGNCGDPNTWSGQPSCAFLNSPGYPAAYPNAMAVASTTILDTRSSFSTQGSYVEIAAPGSNIYSTYLSGGYHTVNGTSQAAPHVAGLAAAIWSHNPGLTNTQVRQIMKSTAVDLGSPGWDNEFGYGRINALAAVQNAGTSSLSASSDVPMTVPETAVVNLDAPFVPGEIIVKLDTVFAQSAGGVDAFDLGITSSGVTINRVDAIDAYIMNVPVGEELDYIEQLNSLDGVEYAEPNYIVTIQ